MKLIKDLPDIFEEFEAQQRKSFLEMKECKENGIPIIGTYCSYFPAELAIAVGAIPSHLCAYSNNTIPRAERELPKGMCPLVKSSYGYAVEDKCPIFHFSDLVIGEATCDGKKKMYELLAEIKPIFVMEIPVSQSKEALKFWEQEIIRTKEYLEEFFNVVITEDKLREAIWAKNRMRRSLKRLCEIMKLEPAPILGRDLLKLVCGTKYRYDYRTAPDSLEEVTDRILQEYQAGKMLDSRPRIMVTGCPIGGDTLKIVRMIEDNGGVVVAMDNCTGARAYVQMVDEDNPNLYEALAEGYMKMGCPIMTPNDNRIELIGQLIDDYKVDGVIDVILTGCHTTGIESVYIRKFVNEEKGIPYIAISTDYAIEETGEIATQISELLARITAEKAGDAKIDMNYCYKIVFSGLAESKEISVILRELYDYTKIPLVLINNEGQVIAYVGAETAEEWRNWERKVEVDIPNGGGKCIGMCSYLQKQPKVKEVLEMVVRGYLLQKNTIPKYEKNKEKSIPDYLWILLDDISKAGAFTAKIKGKFEVFDTIQQNKYYGVLVSAIKKMEERKDLIQFCQKYAEGKDIHIVVGNGFRDLAKQDANRKALEKLFAIGYENNSTQKVYPIEEYYQELAIDFVTGKIGEKNYKIVDLEKIKEDDREKEGCLYETLYWYLIMKRNATQTANTLKIHRNTLLGRIAKINEIIHLDEKDSMECERLLLAMQLERANENK